MGRGFPPRFPTPALPPYHAIKLALPHLNGGGKFALVIGLSGLGIVGVQILEALTGATVKTAMASTARQSRVTIVGIGNPSPYEWAFLSTPFETEVVDVHKADHIASPVTTYSMDQVLDACQLQVEGQIAGRAVAVPHQ